MDCWPVMFSKLILSKPPWQTQLLFHLFSGFLLRSQPAFPCTPPSFPHRAGMLLLAHCLSFGNSTSNLINSSHSCLLATKKTNPPSSSSALVTFDNLALCPDVEGGTVLPNHRQWRSARLWRGRFGTGRKSGCKLLSIDGLFQSWHYSNLDLSVNVYDYSDL